MGLGLTTYRDSLDFLYARTTGAWKLGLERVEAFLADVKSLRADLEKARKKMAAGSNQLQAEKLEGFGAQVLIPELNAAPRDG